MSGNSFGQRFVVTTFGESHGAALGVVIDGCPAGVPFDLAYLQKQLQRRRPGVAASGTGQIVSARQEADDVEILSGVFQDRTLGTPLAMIVRNKDAKSQDYNDIQKSARIGHADDMWLGKFGHSDHRGGGRSSGRETVARVMAGAVAKMYIHSVHPELQVRGYALEVGPYKLTDAERKEALIKNIDQYQARFPSDASTTAVTQLLEDAVKDGESYGGVAEVIVTHMPSYLGQPVFHKLKADLAAAFLSVGATHGFELGESHSSHVKGSEFHKDFHSENYGGIRGGISTGEDLVLRTSFKPTSSIKDVAKKGRHDPYIVTRAIPVLEAMTCLVLADHILWTKTDRV